MMSQRKSRWHIDIPPPGMKMGQLAEKLWLKEKWIDRRSLARLSEKVRKSDRFPSFK
jgi:hypothetical protein